MTGADAISWRNIHRELRRRIDERQWLPGSVVPTEASLAAEFGCARATVHRAMRELAEAGLIERKRKAGTRVALHRTSRVVFEIPIIRREVERRNAVWSYGLLKQEVRAAPASITARLGLQRGTRMLHIASVHFADKHPFLHEDRWINLAALPGVAKVDFATINANEWLVRNAAYTSGDIAFSAANADPALAEALEAPAGAAIFVVDRITWDKDVPITAVRLSYAPGYRMIVE